MTQFLTNINHEDDSRVSWRDLY